MNLIAKLVGDVRPPRQVRRGYIEGDQNTLDEFWRAFVADIA
jgi:hypothetical protein